MRSDIKFVWGGVALIWINENMAPNIEKKTFLPNHFGIFFSLFVLLYFSTYNYQYVCNLQTTLITHTICIYRFSLSFVLCLSVSKHFRYWHLTPTFIAIFWTYNMCFYVRTRMHDDIYRHLIIICHFATSLNKWAEWKWDRKNDRNERVLE